MTKKFGLLLTIWLILFNLFNLSTKADTVAIVSDTAYAPFAFKDSDQQYKGIDVDIITEVAKRSHWQMTLTHPGFDAAVNAVQAGQADAIMAGMTITEARQKSLPSQSLTTIHLLLLPQQKRNLSAATRT